jgi:hypothetical protein
VVDYNGFQFFFYEGAGENGVLGCSTFDLTTKALATITINNRKITAQREFPPSPFTTTKFTVSTKERGGVARYIILPTTAHLMNGATTK